MMVCCENGVESSGPKGVENSLCKCLTSLCVNKALAVPLVSELFHLVRYSYTIKYLKLFSNVTVTRVTAPCC
jgi:hypothetical protein